MDLQLKNLILQRVDANDLHHTGTIQSLWSGYGSLDRYRLNGSERKSIIIKHIRPPKHAEHPRGWNTSHSHLRKLHSYQVETAWYKHWAGHCSEGCRVPQCLALEQWDDECLIVMEDLDNSGYPKRMAQVTKQEIDACLKWLAHFHATFLGESPRNLWKTGTYWHLDTRPDELATMADGQLKQMASKLDQLLSNTPFRTFVHGDAKVANFCFSNDGSKVAAVDFQYVGGGCGMKDVAYFISSCLDEHDCERLENELLDTYFSCLRQALSVHQPQIDAQAVEAVWRPLYAVAWTDFYRFLQGWSPGHWKIHTYSERLAQQVLKDYA